MDEDQIQEVHRLFTQYVQLHVQIGQRDVSDTLSSELRERFYKAVTEHKPKMGLTGIRFLEALREMTSELKEIEEKSR